MHWHLRYAACSLLLLLAACGPSGFSGPGATGRYTNTITQCAPYAREVSGIQIRGTAGDWWYSAQGRYQRGNVPARGSVLVLRKTGKMPSGHVAVVKNIVNARLLNVTHSNWGNNSYNRRIIYDSMRVEDLSAQNNWTSVRFFNPETGTFGLPYPAFGFIYP